MARPAAHWFTPPQPGDIVCLGKIFELDYNDIWFGVPPQAPYGQIPKLGILHPSLLRRAMAAHTAATQR